MKPIKLSADSSNLTSSGMSRCGTGSVVIQSNDKTAITLSPGPSGTVITSGGLGRPRKPEDKKRVGLSASIDSKTSAQITDWQKRLPIQRPGVVIDRMTTHCLATDFDPVNEKPQKATTPAGVQSRALPKPGAKKNRR